MGWLSFPMHQPVKEWYKSATDNENYEILDIAVVKRNTLYAAIKRKSDNFVYCSILLLRWSKGYYNFSYKDMSEFSGPYERECPERIFKLLSPLNDDNDPNGWAREWRQHVQELYKFRKNPTRFIIHLPYHVPFTNGERYIDFIRKNKRFYGVRNGVLTDLSPVRYNPLRNDFKLIQWHEYGNN